MSESEYRPKVTEIEAAKKRGTVLPFDAVPKVNDVRNGFVDALGQFPEDPVAVLIANIVGKSEQKNKIVLANFAAQQPQERKQEQQSVDQRLAGIRTELGVMA